MKAIVRRSGLGFLLAAAALCTGCSASTLLYFLCPENKHQPEMKQLAADDKKEVRVAILTYSPLLEARPEFIQADRQLSQEFARTLRQLCEENGENVTIVNPRKVEEFKSNHPSWHELPDLGEVGKKFKADYLIYVEINSLSLYEAGSANQLYRGHASLAVQLIDVNKPDESVGPRQFSCTYPDAKGPLPVEDAPAGEFRQAFLGHVAKKLAWCFTASPIREQYYVE
jgi:hypothetical protein